MPSLALSLGSLEGGGGGGGGAWFTHLFLPCYSSLLTSYDSIIITQFDAL